MTIEMGKKLVGVILSICVLSVQGWLVPTLKAEMISTRTAISKQQLQHDRSGIKDLVNREDARAIFSKLGVSAADVDSRIDQMTHDELVRFNQQAEQLPAGSSIVGTVILVLIILVILDLVGATDIFPFINSIN